MWSTVRLGRMAAWYGVWAKSSSAPIPTQPVVSFPDVGANSSPDYTYCEGKYAVIFPEIVAYDQQVVKTRCNARASIRSTSDSDLDLAMSIDYFVSRASVRNEVDGN